MVRPASVLGTIALVLALAAPSAAQDTVRVRGAIDRVEGDLYVVKTRAGAEVKDRKSVV